MTVRLIRGLAAIKAHASVWRSLDERGHGLGPFDRFDIVAQMAIAAETAGHEPVLALVMAGETAVSGLALRLMRTFGLGFALPLAAPVAQYCDAAGDGFDTVALNAVCHALRHEAKIDLVLLRKVRSGHGLAEALAAIGQPQSTIVAAPYIDLAAFGSFPAYEKSFSSSTQRNRRQRRRKLETEHGALSFTVRPGADAPDLVSRAIAWKRQWLAAQGHASPVFDAGKNEAAFRSIAENGFVSVLSAGERPVAIEVGFAAAHDYVAYLGTFDPAFQNFSVGQEQMLRTIEWCFGQGFTRFDLLAPDDDYKRHWTRAVTSVEVMDYAVPLSLLGKNLGEVRRRARPLARSVILSLNPKVRAAGRRYGPHTAILSAALGVSAMLAALE